MYRYALKSLVQWKTQKRRKPLIIRGARQVGKTWLMKRFAEESYEEYVYINFENNTIMKDLFSLDMRIDRILQGLELYTQKKIIPEKTLIILDEIQEVPEALRALKYFNEDAQEYPIVCAGSLLGVALHQNSSFPVGKVEFLDLYPLSFFEFIQALNHTEHVTLLEQGDYYLARSQKSLYQELLKTYYIIGGMPEVVAAFIQNHDFYQARQLQQAILAAYEQDFSKHAPHEIVPRLRLLWNSIPSQLATEHKKFIYGLIKEGSRARDYEMALLWLQDCGLVHKVKRVTTPRLPLIAYEDTKAFKLFILDIGLLCCMSGLHEKTILEGSTLFTQFKGALTEQFVLQQFKTLKDISVWYWTNERSSAEIDFLVDTGLEILPIEVKAEVNLQSKSLKSYREKFSPRLALRCSMADYSVSEGLINLPLYAIQTLPELILPKN